VKSLLFILTTLLAGCTAYVAGPCLEPGSLSDAACDRLARDGTHFIAESFPASSSRLLFPNTADNQKLATTLENTLRAQGYEIGTYTVEDRTPRTLGRAGSIEVANPPSKSTSETVNGVRIVYTASIDEEHKLFYTLRVGDSWQFTRLYRVLADGELEASTQPIIRNNLQ